MKIEITEKDKVNMNLEMARSLVSQALLDVWKEDKAKHTLLAYNLLKNVIQIYNLEEDKNGNV